jgi:predicted transcriptional regulator
MDSGRTRSRDVVGTFLEAVGTPTPRPEERPSAVPARPAPAAADAAGASAAAAPGAGSGAVEAVESGAPLAAMYQVLTHLEGPGTAPMTELAADLGMPLLDVAGLLSKLTATGLVAVEGDPGRENVVITDAGRTIAELA